MVGADVPGGPSPARDIQTGPAPIRPRQARPSRVAEVQETRDFTSERSDVKSRSSPNQRREGRNFAANKI